MELTTGASAPIGNVSVDYNGRAVGTIGGDENIFTKLSDLMARAAPGQKNVTIYAQAGGTEREIHNRSEIDQPLVGYVGQFGRVDRFVITASTIPSGA